MSKAKLMLADLESLEKRIKPLEKKANSGEKEAKEQLALMMKAITLLREGKPARRAELAPEERGPYSQLGLMTAKPVLYVCNVEEGSAATGNAISAKVEAMAKAEGARSVVISAKIEEEIAQMPMEDRPDFLGSLGLEEPGLNRLIRTGYELLGLLTFFTVGPKEARAWTVTKGSKGPQAAGVIHTDFEHGYIRAETIAYPDYVAGKGEAGAREAGKFRLEGKEYVVADGDVMHFRFNN
jgi:GTP-binding protein YchF